MRPGGEKLANHAAVYQIKNKVIGYEPTVSAFLKVDTKYEMILGSPWFKQVNLESIDKETIRWPPLSL